MYIFCDIPLHLLAPTLPFFCLFKAPKYKWLFSPKSSLSFILSTILFLRISNVFLLAPVPLLTYLPVKALGALFRGSSVELLLLLLLLWFEGLRTGLSDEEKGMYGFWNRERENQDLQGNFGTQCYSWTVGFIHFKLDIVLHMDE
jgi:hypothetical protein